MVYSSGTTDSKFVELSLGVHTAMDFPWGNGMWEGREREEGRRPSLVDERRRPVVVGSWGPLGVVHEQWISWMSGRGSR
jgi:hypothetical protein